MNSIIKYVTIYLICYPPVLQLRGVEMNSTQKKIKNIINTVSDLILLVEVSISIKVLNRRSVRVMRFV